LKAALPDFRQLEVAQFIDKYDGLDGLGSSEGQA
jgi:hypothetical protein